MDDIQHPKKRKRVMSAPGYSNASMNADSLVTPVPAVLVDSTIMGDVYPQTLVPSPVMGSLSHSSHSHQVHHSHHGHHQAHHGHQHSNMIPSHTVVPQPVPIPTVATATSGSMIAPKKVSMPKRRRLNEGSSVFKGDGEKSTWVNNPGGGEMKKGKFSKTENEILLRAIEEYCKSANIDKQALAEQDLRSANIRGCWTNLAACLPNRSSHSIYGHAIRMIHVGNHKGRWTDEEEANLHQLVSIHGNKWKYIGEQLGRYWLSVRDKWRTIKNKNYKKGHWSPEEEDTLVQLVLTHHSREHNMGPGENIAPKHNIYWKKIASLFPTRNVTQLRTKWQMTLHKDVLKKSITQEDSVNIPGSLNYRPALDKDAILIKAIYDSGAVDESEVNWGRLPLKCTSYVAKQQWRQLVKRVPDHSNMQFESVLDYLHNTHMTNNMLNTNLVMNTNTEAGVATLLGRDIHVPVGSINPIPISSNPVLNSHSLTHRLM